MTPEHGCAEVQLYDQLNLKLSEDDIDVFTKMVSSHKTQAVFVFFTS